MTYSSSASIRRRNCDHAAEPPARFLTFESRLEESRRCFIGKEPVANPWSLHHVNEEIFCKYQQLCIRGFLVQGILLLDYPAIAEARRMVEDVWLIYTVLYVRPIGPRVVRECISNLCSADDRVYIRGCRFDFDPVVINQQFMTPFVEKSHVWEDEDLTQAIVFLTVDASSIPLCTPSKGVYLFPFCPRSSSSLRGDIPFFFDLCKANDRAGSKLDSARLFAELDRTQIQLGSLPSWSGPAP
ncbi:hypothetical protein F2Q69_00052893 [Brassica cretica]|uniref:Uncharacterized protein n=1 Tax=Brassica cretica TaxID=69181 RepID=A0A8S9MXB6_BRACR|nr:hypothetical protein F2Q69_00052893 [Brassica cretica]